MSFWEWVFIFCCLFLWEFQACDYIWNLVRKYFLIQLVTENIITNELEVILWVLIFQSLFFYRFLAVYTNDVFFYCNNIYWKEEVKVCLNIHFWFLYFCVVKKNTINKPTDRQTQLLYLIIKDLNLKEMKMRWKNINNYIKTKCKT